MKKVLKNLLSVEVETDLNEYHFKSIDGTLVIRIKDFNIIHFNYIFNDIKITKEAFYGSAFISENYIGNNYFNLIEDAPLIEDKDCFIITIKSDLIILIEKSSALVSIYKDDVLVHGGKLGKVDTAVSTNQVKVLKAKGDDSFISKFTFSLDEDDDFYGMSDKVVSLNKNSKSLGYFNKNSILQDSSSNSFAFFIKTKKNGCSCGILFDQCSIDEMNFGVENPLYYSVSSHDSPSSYYFFDGYDYKEILKAYYDVIGYPSFPPLFTFGYMESFMNHLAENIAADKIIEFFNKIEDYQIPCEGLYASSRYLNNFDECQYSIEWDSNLIVKKNDYLKLLFEKGYHLAMNIKPGMPLKHSMYKELDKKGYFIKDEFGNSYVDFSSLGDASYIDFTNINAYEWWEKYLKEKLISNGCSGIWYDGNEFAIEDPGVSLYKIKSILPLIMNKASNDAFDKVRGKSAKKRHWITSRREYSGIPFTKNKIKNSFNRTLTNELLLRLIEGSVFKTSLVIHSLLEEQSEEVVNHFEILPIIVNLIKMHYTFLPYIYNAAFESHLEGLPLNRLLCMEFKDKRINPRTSDSLFGNSILKVLVADEGVTQRVVYLPKDCHWYNASNKKFYYGGVNVAVDASPGTFNYFVKEGSIIEMNRDNDKRLTTGLFKNLDLRIYRIKDEKRCVSNYFEDDGETHLDENEFNIYKLELTKKRFIITKTQCRIKGHGRIFNVCNEIGNNIASFDPDKLEEGESISYKL